MLTHGALLLNLLHQSDQAKPTIHVDVHQLKQSRCQHVHTTGTSTPRRRPERAIVGYLRHTPTTYSHNSTWQRPKVFSQKYHIEFLDI
uniref:Uncharacterized protein n=1 Tax=Oryza brachyantha TaxID=4533 RepID=J3LAW4_ORYBR